MPRISDVHRDSYTDSILSLSEGLIILFVASSVLVLGALCAVSFGKNRDGRGNQKRDIQNVQNKGKEARLSNAPDPLDQERA